MFFKQKLLSGWGNFPKSLTRISAFQSADDLRETLAMPKLIARGLGRSYADQATNTDNHAIDFTSYNRFIHFDDDKGILECETGVSYDDIIRVLGPRGWFPMICPGTRYVTIGGAIANDVHGKAHHIDGSFINCVDEITLMLANGEIVKADRERHSDLFYASFGGLGLLGFIMSAKIRLRRIDSTYFDQLSIPVRNLDEMMDILDTRDKDFSYSVAWVNPLAKGSKLGKGVVNFGNHAKIDELPFSKMIEPIKITGGPKLNIPVFLPSFSLNRFSVSILNNILYWKQRRGSGISHYDSFFFPLDMINHWNRGYGSRGFIQYQFVIPLEKGRENLRTILTSIAESGCTPFLNVLKKFGKGKSGPLSFPMEGYTLAVDFPVSEKLKPFAKKLDELVIACGGRVYLGKDAFLNEENFKKMYPAWEDWLKVKQKYDPENVFSSDLSRRIGLC